jgi:hypothetical protein
MPEIYLIKKIHDELAMTIRWTVGPDGWMQHAPLFAGKVELAREMVPPQGIWIPDCPSSFADEAYEIPA